MRCSGWSSLAISACSALALLLLASPAAAHVVAAPAFVPSGGSESVTFSGPNERDVPMTAFALTVPEGSRSRTRTSRGLGRVDRRLDGDLARWTACAGRGDRLRDHARSRCRAGRRGAPGRAALPGRRRGLVAGRAHGHPGGREPVAEPRARRRRRAHRRAARRRRCDARLAPAVGLAPATSREIAGAAATVARGHDLHAVRRRRARVCVLPRRRSADRPSRRRRSRPSRSSSTSRRPSGGTSASSGSIETHTHADHLAGHGRLALEHDVPVSIHPAANAEYPHDALEDGDEIVLGEVVLRCIHTPGHRPEHCCLAVSDLTRGAGAVDRPHRRLAVRRRRRTARPRGRGARGRRGPVPLAPHGSSSSATASRSTRGTSPGRSAARR